jgi:hypothetical protein
MSLPQRGRQLANCGGWQHPERCSSWPPCWACGLSSSMRNVEPITVLLAASARGCAVNSRGRLVQEDQRRPGDQAGREVQAAAHRAGELRDRLVRRFLKVEVRQQPLSGGARIGRPQALQPARRAAAVATIIGARLVRTPSGAPEPEFMAQSRQSAVQQGSASAIILCSIWHCVACAAGAVRSAMRQSRFR